MEVKVEAERLNSSEMDREQCSILRKAMNSRFIFLRALENVYIRGKFLNRDDKSIRDRRGDRKILFIRVTISNKAEKGGMIQFGETSSCVMGVTMLRDIVCEII